MVRESECRRPEPPKVVTMIENRSSLIRFLLDEQRHILADVGLPCAEGPQAARCHDEAQLPVHPAPTRAFAADPVNPSLVSSETRIILPPDA